MKKKTVQIFVWILCFLLLLFFTLSAALPSWLSTPSGTKTVVGWINARIDGKLTIGKLDVNWLGSQRVENVTWLDGSGNLIFNLHFLETHTSLLYLLFGGRSLGKTTVEEPYLYLSEQTTEKLHQTQKRKAGLKKTRKRGWCYPTFKSELHVHNGNLIFAAGRIPGITIAQIQIDKNARNDSFTLSAQTTQGKQDGTITVEAVFAEKIQATVNLLNFPLAALDGLEGSSLFTDALGPTLSLEMHLEKDGHSSLSIYGTASSANLTAYVEGVTEDNKFNLSPQTRLDFTVTPALFKALIDEQERKDWDLASKTQIKIEVETGIFPMTLSTPRFEDIVLQANLSIDRAELHHQSLGSYSLKHFTGFVIAHQNLEIAYEGEIQGKEQTKLSGTISITPEKGVLFQYAYQGFPVSLLSLFSSELEKNVRLLFGGQFDMESEGTYVNNELDAHVTVASRQTQLNGHLTGTLPEFSFESTGTTQIPHDKAKLIGKSLDFNLNGKMNLTENQLSIPFVKGNVSNAFVSLDLRGKIGEEGLPLTPDTMQLMATGVIKKLPVQEGQASPALTIENTIVYLQVDGAKNHIYIKAEGPGVDAVIDVDQFIQNDSIVFPQAQTTFSTQLQNFPSNVLGLLISETLDLSAFVGDSLNVKARGSYTPLGEPRFSMAMNAEGSGFFASLGFTLDGTLAVQQDHPSYIHWDITPERYNALMHTFQLDQTTEPTFILSRTTQLKLDITQFSCPTSFPQDLSHFLCQSGFVGNIHLDPATFHSQYAGESITFQGVKGFIKGENFSQGIDLILSGDMLAANIPQSEKSSFAFDGQMLNFWTPDGHFNRQGLTIKGALSLDLLPVRQVSGIVPLDPETRTIVQAILGELMNARIYGEISQLSGPLTIDIKASNFKANLPLQLHQNEIYLRDYVDAEITLTEAVNATLLKDVNPLFISGAYSDHPLKLYIDPHGFMMPIRPFSLQGVRIGKAILDIGKIRVRNGGQVEYLVNFLQAKEFSQDGLMQAWFTPIFISLQDGVASYKRFDALLGNNIHIAMWGSINLINNHVSMTLGIAPTTLRERFKIAGLHKQDMFQVLMRGTTDKLELDWSSAYTRIAFLVAKTAGGGIGLLIGGLLEPIITASLGEEPVPPLTTDPLPWESQYPSEPGQTIPKEAFPRRGSRKSTRRYSE